MSALVLDASVAVKLVSEESDSQAALERVASASRIVAPDWMMIEASHALWKKTKVSSFEAVQVRAGIEALRQIVDTLVPAVALVSSALDFAFRLSHPVYGCLYLALAEAEDAVVLTADHRFVQSAQRAGLASRVECLGSA